MTEAANLPPLCAVCNMCCDGTVFTQAPMRAGEEAQAEAVGMTVFDYEGRPAFALPCPRITPQGCSVYERRPDKCKRFRCPTLVALDIGEIDDTAARARVARAQKASARLLESAPGHADVAAIRRNVHACGAQGDPRQLVALAALEMLLDRYFRNWKSPVLNRDQAATTVSP